MTKTKAIISLGLVAGLGMVALPLTSYADSHSATEQVVVSVAESITITNTTNTASGLAISGGDVSAGTVKTGAHGITVATSAAAGYTLTMAADHADLKLEDAVTAGTYTGASGFTGIGGSATAATGAGYKLATLGTGATFSATAPSAGVWGYRLNDDGNSNAAAWTANNYVSVPTSAFTIAMNDTAVSGETTTVTFGVQAGTTTPSGDYGANITYTATTK